MELLIIIKAVVRERDLQTESAVKNQKELISLQDSVKKLESLAENRLKELKKCENLVKDLAAERYALDKERDKVILTFYYKSIFYYHMKKNAKID